MWGRQKVLGRAMRLQVHRGSRVTSAGVTVRACVVMNVAVVERLSCRFIEFCVLWRAEP